MFNEFAKNRIILFDGAMGTSIQNYEITDEIWQGYNGCSEWLNVAAPEIIQQIHEQYFEAGADVVETNTFGGTELVMSEYDLQDRTYELNLLGAQIARRAADKYGKYTAGSIGPGTKLPSLGQISYDDLYTMYHSQAEALLEGGVDLFIIETCQDLLQIKSALNAVIDVKAEKNSDAPVMVSITVEQNGTMLMGTDISAAVTLLREYPVFSLGLNCSTGPDLMHNPINDLAQNFNGRISCIPNAGLPENRGGQMVYDMTPDKMAKIVEGMVQEFPIGVLGGCCGTTPEHIKALRPIADKYKPNKPQAKEYTGESSSLYVSTTLMQTPPPALIGERANANGSKAFRELLLAEDFDGMLAVAKEQEETGAHFIDACVAYAGRDEKADMAKFMHLLNKTLTAPVVIDSTEPDVVETALKSCAGKPVINSINFEDGGEKLHIILRAVKKHPASVIALTIDEDGMAMTAEKKFEIAERIYNIFTKEYGLNPNDLIFDPLTFSIGSGDKTLVDAAIQTNKAIKMIKEKLTGAKTALGLSNISFGLSKDSRPILNSVFLHEAVEHGLDMAIVHASKVMPQAAIPEEDIKVSKDLLAGQEGALSAFIEHFSKKEGIVQQEEKTDLPPDEMLKNLIKKGRKAGLEETLTALMQTMKPIEIINNIMLDTMKEIGELFGAGKMLLPFVLQSAETMKTAVTVLEPFMEKSDTETRGRIVLATVKGDVHDIGKNLVDIILSNNGYEVYNLGIKVSVEEMIAKAVEMDADAIGMSGLLVKSTNIMRENIAEINRQGLSKKVLLGGAALTEKFVKNDCMPIMPGMVSYCRDAFDALKVLSGESEGSIAPEKTYADISAKPKKVQSPKLETPPAPPFFGVKTAENYTADDILEYMNKLALFSHRWGYSKKNMPDYEYEELLTKTVIPEFNETVQEIKDKELLEMGIRYAYFPCNSDGEELIVYNEDGSELTRFVFPRQNLENGVCLADYFHPVSSGVKDVVAFHIVTAGSKPAEYCQQLFKNNEYKKYYQFHGFFTEFAEAMAEYAHKMIRTDLKIDHADAKTAHGIISLGYSGRRYSFGYPSCPDLAQNNQLDSILDFSQIGVSITENHEMVSEYTTCAIIIHNSSAEYFTT
ncbi:methionine synthase [Denitrovibrio acetiphilus DSM 12809]|uniref:Methionine synthase n=1 Tax=Denitrovibrio acetiphilus (strain DSM 12809 / NBRC 114555 / N2460) TaxID=522772 RepID=D4H5Z8_DENA2|nr:methionine synthase [Denitrovibrio acetiphilus]ADD67644.1 methionine synthase [Denitrovibrio acetiphilus DSM 12809]